MYIIAFTTLEFWEKRGKESKRPEFYQISPFDIGIYRNICHVLGPYPIFWLLPARYNMCSCGEDLNECVCGTSFTYNPNHPAVLAWKNKFHIQNICHP